MNVLVVIDMQNDFLTGSLANPAAVAIIPKVKEWLEKARKEHWKIIFTRDTHYSDYLFTTEGAHLPIKHCLQNSVGWQITTELEPKQTEEIIDKEYFGYDCWNCFISPDDTVYICGTLTSVCVASNASIMKTLDNVEVNVIADACADLNDDIHQAALKVMEAQQCNII